LPFDYVIRLRGKIKVTAVTGVTRTAAAWVSPSGRARVLRAAMVTADHYPVGTVVCVRDPDMKQACCLAASSAEATARDLSGYYGSRWGLEAGLRGTKDLRYGMGMGTVDVSTPERRDRLWLINALAVVLLTLLGAPSAAIGYDKILKTNTSKRREHPLFRQGCMIYHLIPTMPERWLQPLIWAFTQMLDQQPFFTRTLGQVQL
jgi:hypothetical protein